jgi:hypothetical protein
MISNKPNNQPQRLLSEGLQYKDLEGLLKPTIHVDEFSSKMGDDQDIIVLSFFARDKAAAKDLMGWFEKGYDFVLDSDMSPGEVKPNRYLVYVEMRRRSAAPKQINEMLEDLATLTEFDADDWMMTYRGQEQPWDPESFAAQVPLTPKDYVASTESDLNEWRVAAGLETKKIHEVSPALRALQAAAGI